MSPQEALEARIRSLVASAAPREQIEPLVRVVAVVLHEMFADPSMVGEIKLVQELQARNRALEAEIKRLLGRPKSAPRKRSTSNKTVREVFAERATEAKAERAQTAQTMKDAFAFGFEDHP
jgi:hypothetical protein